MKPKLKGKEMFWAGNRPYQLKEGGYLPLKIGDEGMSMHFQFYSDNSGE